MNMHADLQQIELVRLVVLTNKTIEEMQQLCPADIEIEVTGNWIRLIFIGRGTEQMSLTLPVLLNV